MALLSVHNLVAPLTNKTNLFLIILLAALFGGYRLSGGGISVVAHDGPSKRRTIELAQPENTEIVTSEESDSEDLVGEMLRDENSGVGGRKASASPGRDDLAEIERQVGLR